jgi:hypothetical protein
MESRAVTGQTGGVCRRAARSTRGQIKLEEADQTTVIGALRHHGIHPAADRVARCQQHRGARRANLWPFRCRSVLCWACRRTRMLSELRAALAWATESGSTTSVAVIPLSAHGMTLTRTSTRLRVRLRRLRDAKAQTRWSYSGVAMIGLLATGVAVGLLPVRWTPSLA